MAPQEQHEFQPVPVEVSTPPMSEVNRIVGVFSSPAEAFRDIAVRPRWWIPVLLIAALGFVYSTAFGAKIGYARAAHEMVESTTRAANMTPVELDAAAVRIASFMKYQGYLGIVWTALGIFVVAAVMKLFFDVLMGAGIGLNRVMGIVAYSNLPTLVYLALALLVLNLKSPETFSVVNPLAFNVGAFLPSGTAPWMRSVGRSLDLFSLWIIVLIAIGVSTASRKIAFGKALATVLFAWGVYVVMSAGASALNPR